MLVAALPLLAACGGSSPTPATTVQATQSGAAVSAAHSREPASDPASSAPADPVSKGVVVHRPFRGTGGKEINDDNPGNADVGSDPEAGNKDPCKLVSRAEAQAIVGRPVATPQEAPLGPTCIYQSVGTKTFVTLTVAGVDLARLKPDIRHLTRMKVDGRSGYCGVYGQPTTFVPLPNGKVLNITAPCMVGRLFAAKALIRLKA